MPTLYLWQEPVCFDFTKYTTQKNIMTQCWYIILLYMRQNGQSYMGCMKWDKHLATEHSMLQMFIGLTASEHFKQGIFSCSVFLLNRKPIHSFDNFGYFKLILVWICLSNFSAKSVWNMVSDGFHSYFHKVYISQIWYKIVKNFDIWEFSRTSLPKWMHSLSIRNMD